MDNSVLDHKQSLQRIGGKFKINFLLFIFKLHSKTIFTKKITYRYEKSSHKSGFQTMNRLISLKRHSVVLFS